MLHRRMSFPLFAAATRPPRSVQAVQTLSAIRYRGTASVSERWQWNAQPFVKIRLEACFPTNRGGEYCIRAAPRNSIKVSPEQTTKDHFLQELCICCAV